MPKGNPVEVSSAPETGQVFYKHSSDDVNEGWLKYKVKDGGSWPIQMTNVPRNDIETARPQGVRGPVTFNNMKFYSPSDVRDIHTY